MKKLIVFLMLLSFVLAGSAWAAADKTPKALKGVDLKAAQKVTDKQAKEVRGTAIQLRLQDQIRIPGVGDYCPSLCQ